MPSNILICHFIFVARQDGKCHLILSCELFDQQNVARCARVFIPCSRQTFYLLRKFFFTCVFVHCLRTCVICTHFTFTFKEVPDTSAQILEQCSRRLNLLLTHWKTVATFFSVNKVRFVASQMVPVVFRLSATVKRKGLIESCMCCRGGLPPPN